MNLHWRPIFIGFILLVALTTLQAQSDDYYFHSSRNSALSGADLSSNNVNTIFLNPASFLSGAKWAFSGNGEERFAGTNIRSASGLFAGQFTQNDQAHLTINYFGNSAYSRQSIGLGYARKIIGDLSAGIRGHFSNVSIEGLENQYFFSGSLGFQYQAHRDVQLGLVIDDIFNTIYEDQSNGNINPKLNFSVAYSAGRVASIYVASHDILANKYRSFAVGTSYFISKNFGLHASVRTLPRQYAFGISYLLNDAILFDMAVKFHQFLPITPSIGFNYVGLGSDSN